MTLPLVYLRNSLTNLIYSASNGISICSRPGAEVLSTRVFEYITSTSEYFLNICCEN